MADPWRRKPLPRTSSHGLEFSGSLPPHVTGGNDRATFPAFSKTAHGSEAELAGLLRPKNGDVVVAGARNEEERTPSSSTPPPPSPIHENSIGGLASPQSLQRHLTLVDLLSIGVGGTIGSGIFVISGLVARDHAGPAVSISWLVAGIAACLSGVCYAELAGRIPSEGSAYAYAFVSMGELPAVVAAACLTLEYGVSGAAVARSWGDKVVVWLRSETLEGDQSPLSYDWIDRYLQPGYGINPMAFLVSAASVLLLLGGVRESKAVTNFFTVTKLCLVVFMTVGGFLLLKPSNFSPFIPPQYGLAGVFRGATSSFFGFVGYDEACCLAGEALHPSRDMPRAVLFTIACVTALYVLAALALTGMQSYTEIDATSGFPEAFRSNDANWAARIAAFGEVITMPVVVLIALLAQPRLQYALARDGLLPRAFAEVDQFGNLRKGILTSGIAMTLLAAFVPFEYLNDLISSGILLAFSMTDGSLILLRRQSPRKYPSLLPKMLIAFNLTSFGASLLLSSCLDSMWGKILAAILCLLAVVLVYGMSVLCCPSAVFGGSVQQVAGGLSDCEHNADMENYFQTPMVPYLPCLGTFVNWYLISQLEARGMILLATYVGLTILLYFAFSKRRKWQGTNDGDNESDNNAHFGWPGSESNDDCSHHLQFGSNSQNEMDSSLHRMISLPRRSAN